MVWGILMVLPQSAAADGPKKNRTDTCFAPVSFLKKKKTSLEYIYTYGESETEWGRSNMYVHCLIPVTMI